VGDNTSPVLFGTDSGSEREQTGRYDRGDDDTREQPTPTGPVGPDTAPRGCPDTQAWYDRVKRKGLDYSVKNRLGLNKKTICDCMLNTLPGCSGTSPVTDQPDPVVKSNIEISDTIPSTFKYQIINNSKKLQDGEETNYFCSPGLNADGETQTACAGFLNNASTDITSVGDAWKAYANSTLGKTIYSAFKGQKDKVNDVVDLWKRMESEGGIKDENDKRHFYDEAKSLISSMVPRRYNGPALQMDDVVGIYWNGSDHHHEAFYNGAKAGRGWFKNCGDLVGESGCSAAVPGNTLNRGDLWGMNTHIGRVLVEKDGKPFIVHNVGGDVRATPAEDLPIAWVGRK